MIEGKISVLSAFLQKFYILDFFLFIFLNKGGCRCYFKDFTLVIIICKTVADIRQFLCMP